MYESLQLMGSIVVGGLIIVIGLWIAWLMGACYIAKAKVTLRARVGSNAMNTPLMNSHSTETMVPALMIDNPSSGSACRHALDL